MMSKERSKSRGHQCAPPFYLPAPHRQTALNPNARKKNYEYKNVAHHDAIFVFFVNIDPCLPVCPFLILSSTKKKRTEKNERKIGKQKKTAPKASRAKRRVFSHGKKSTAISSQLSLLLQQKPAQNPNPTRPKRNRPQPINARKKIIKKDTNHKTQQPQQTTKSLHLKTSTRTPFLSSICITIAPKSVLVRSTAGQILPYPSERPGKKKPSIPRQTLPYLGQTLSCLGTPSRT